MKLYNPIWDSKRVYKAFELGKLLQLNRVWLEMKHEKILFDVHDKINILFRIIILCNNYFPEQNRPAPLSNLINELKSLVPIYKKFCKIFYADQMKKGHGVYVLPEDIENFPLLKTKSEINAILIKQFKKQFSGNPKSFGGEPWQSLSAVMDDQYRPGSINKVPEIVQIVNAQGRDCQRKTRERGGEYAQNPLAIEVLTTPLFYIEFGKGVGYPIGYFVYYNPGDW